MPWLGNPGYHRSMLKVILNSELGTYVLISSEWLLNVYAYFSANMWKQMPFLPPPKEIVQDYSKQYLYNSKCFSVVAWHTGWVVSDIFFFPCVILEQGPYLKNRQDWWFDLIFLLGFGKFHSFWSKALGWETRMTINTWFSVLWVEDHLEIEEQSFQI